MAWSMGWQAAKQVSGSDWLGPYLANLLNDPYDAVRFIAFVSLRRLPGFGDFAYDAGWPAEARSAASERAFVMWNQSGGAAGRRGDGTILIDPLGAVNRAEFSRLLLRRDDREVSLIE